MTPTLSGAAILRRLASAFTRVGLESELCCTSRLFPLARASLIWLSSCCDCTDVATVADPMAMRAKHKSAATTSTTASVLAMNTTVEGMVWVLVRVPWPGTTRTRGRSGRSGTRSE